MPAVLAEVWIDFKVLSILHVHVLKSAGNATSPTDCARGPHEGLADFSNVKSDHGRLL